MLVSNVFAYDLDWNFDFNAYLFANSKTILFICIHSFLLFSSLVSTFFWRNYIFIYPLVYIDKIKVNKLSLIYVYLMYINNKHTHVHYILPNADIFKGHIKSFVLLSVSN